MVDAQVLLPAYECVSFTGHTHRSPTSRGGGRVCVPRLPTQYQLHTFIAIDIDLTMENRPCRTVHRHTACLWQGHNSAEVLAA